MFQILQKLHQAINIFNVQIKQNQFLFYYISNLTFKKLE